jgi:hypothetical protein
MSTSYTPISNIAAGAADPTQDAPPAAPIPQADPAALQSAATGGVAQAVQAPAPQSRLQAIVQAVANVASTAMQGIPDKGRSSFVTGLGEGARAAQAAQATQAGIKFKTFDDQVRLAQLHNQDLALQNATQAQTDAHTKAEIDTRALAEKYGLDYDTIANHGPSVMEHLTAQTAANGAASVPPGTHVSADGSSIYVPKAPDSQATKDAQKQMYNALGPAFGLPTLSPVSDVRKATDMLTNLLHGYQPNGQMYNHDVLPGVIAAAKTQLDQLKKSGASPDAVKAYGNRIDILQAQNDALDAHAASLADDAAQRKTDATIQVNNAKAAQQRQTNAAKPQAAKPQQSVVGFDPQSNERVVVNASDPRAANLQQAGKVSSQQMDQWGTSQNQFANVQLAVSRYDQAARNFAQSGKPSDAVGINSALNKAGVGDVQIGEWGVKVPGFSSVAEAASRVANSAAFKSLSPAGQDLVDKYFRMMSSIPEYQKASTGIGRTNKEMLDLELKNIPDPTMPPSIISNRLSSFQEALGSNASRVPKIQGVPHYKDVQQHYQQPTQTPSGGNNLGQAVMGNANDFINRLVPSN